MQLKLKRRDDVKIRSWINDKPVTNDDWDVYSEIEDEDDDKLLLVLIEKGTNNQFKIEIKKYTPTENNENIETPNEERSGVQESTE
jgi:hypothetical protein